MDHLKIGSPLTLQCGLTLPNRLAKAAMAENMADEKARPSAQFKKSYGEWSNGGWGLVITGNVQVDSKYLGQALDVTPSGSVDHQETLTVWKEWAETCQSEGTPTIVQINHPGKQSPAGAGSRGFFEKNISPSAIPLDFGKGLVSSILSSFVFGTPREMTTQDIEDVVKGFASTARLASEAGFSGVEIHAAHGYLLAQFLSEKSNQRTDEYGGSPSARAKIIVDVINAIRAEVPKTFCVGIKLNSADHQTTHELEACKEQLKLITDAGVDFLEISGGSYENPTMATGLDATEKPVSERTTAREAFFLEFAKSIRSSFPDVPLMVTGGFRSRQAMEAAVADGDCDLVGIARPAALDPLLPKRVIFNSELSDENAKVYARKIQPSWLVKKFGVKAIGAGAETGWYTKQIQTIGKL